MNASSLEQTVAEGLEVQSAQADFALRCPQIHLPGYSIGSSPCPLIKRSLN